MQQQQIITPQRRPVRRYDYRDLERVERECAYRPQGRVSYGGGQNEELAASAPATTPLTILGAAAWWVRSDLLVTQAAGTASAWGDSSGNGVNFTAGAGQPTYSATGLDGRPTLRGNNSNKIMTATFARVAPATQPFCMWFIARVNTWTVNKYLWGDGGAAIFQNDVTPRIRPFNGVNGTILAVGLGTWYRIRAQFTAGDTCIFKVGAAAEITSATGSNASGATTGLFANPASSLFSDCEIAEAFCHLGTPSAGQHTSLDAYAAGLYPSVTF